jgi:hypothetical protein
MWADGVTGKRNASLSFDGTDDYVAISDSNSLDYGTGDFSVSLWAKTSETCTGNKVYWGQRSGSAPSVWLGCHATGNTIGFDVDSSATGYSNINGKTAINDDEWHHLVGVKKGHSSNATIYIYVDGKLENYAGSRSYSGDFNFAAGATVNSIGRFNVSPYYYPAAQIDDVRVFNYALTQQQIDTIVSDGSVRFGPDSGSP